MEISKIEIQEKDLELIVSEKTLGSLTTNAIQIKELVEQALPNYDIANYNENNISLAKKDKAMLNNAAKALNSKRIEFEKEFLKPFTEFKEVVNETVKLISVCSGKIDLVIKQSEQKAKEEKKQIIVDYWKSKEFNLVSFDKIFDEKWLNKTSKEKNIKIEIDNIIEKINDDIATLEAVGEDVDLLKSLYLDTLNINNTIQYANTLKANREKAKIESEQRVKHESKNNIQTNVNNPWLFENPEPTNEPSSVVNQPELLTRAMKVWGTREQIIALGNFMNENGIRFEKLEL